MRFGLMYSFITPRDGSMTHLETFRELERLLGVELVELSVVRSAREPWLESARELVDRTHARPGGGA